jgi:hypothetical protein
MRRLAMTSLAAVLVLAACSGSSATQKPGGGGGNQPTATANGGGGGGGSATITIGGSATKVSNGACVDGGSVGVDIRFGDPSGTGTDWIVGLVHRDGSPGLVSGSVGSKLFVLDPATATIGSDNKGTFSGTDKAGGNGAISATFTCN